MRTAITQNDMEQFQEDLLSYYSAFYCPEDIVSDGILELSFYQQAATKLLWLCKEPYGKGKWDYADDLVGFFSFGQKFPTSTRFWTNITYVNYGILNGFPVYDDIADLDKDVEVFNHLRAGALVNIKKTTGTTQSIYRSIKEHYDQHREFLHRQIHFIDPDIIICGGTFNMIKNGGLLHDAVTVGDERGFVAGNRLFVNAFHPAYFGIDHEAYYNQVMHCCKMWRPL